MHQPLEIFATSRTSAVVSGAITVFMDTFTNPVKIFAVAASHHKSDGCL